MVNEPLPTALEVLADIDRRASAAKIPQVLAVKNSASPSAARRSLWMKTHLYSSHGCRYARFCWGKGSEVWGYVHIVGGSCTDVLVQNRRAEVDRLIAAGAALSVILSLLRSWDNARAGRKRQGEQ